MSAGMLRDCKEAGESLTITEAIHPLDKSIHGIPDHPEPKDTTRTTLNVLTQCTEELELHFTTVIEVRRATVDRLIVGGASKMLVETRQGLKISMAEVAFEAVPIPSALSSPGLGRASDHAIWVGDEVVGVVFSDKSVYRMARGA